MLEMTPLLLAFLLGFIVGGWNAKDRFNAEMSYQNTRWVNKIKEVEAIYKDMVDVIREKYRETLDDLDGEARWRELRTAKSAASRLAKGAASVSLADGR